MNQISNLSKQEMVMLNALSSGSLYKEIAADHHISINTVKKHLKNVYRKLDVGKRTHAIEKYLAGSSTFSFVAETEIPLESSVALAV